MRGRIQNCSQRLENVALAGRKTERCVGGDVDHKEIVAVVSTGRISADRAAGEVFQGEAGEAIEVGNDILDVATVSSIEKHTVLRRSADVEVTKRKASYAVAEYAVVATDDIQAGKSRVVGNLEYIGIVGSDTVHRGQVTRFIARPRWQSKDFNETLRNALLQMETVKGKFLFIVDATLTTQTGVKTQNTYTTARRRNKSKKKGRHYRQRTRRRCHIFTGGLLITPSRIRIPFQIPHYTKEHCKQNEIEYRTTAESAANMIRSLPVPDDAEVIVLGDTAYDAQVVCDACKDQGYSRVFPANPERVYEVPKGDRPQVRSRLKDWTSLSLKTIRLRASTGKYSNYRRLSSWRIGPKQKTRVYYAHQEKCEVRNVGFVQLIFSTMKPELKKATTDELKILMTNATDLSVSEVIELYSLRWQIELFFKELKLTLGFSQYSFEKFQAVEG